MLPAEVRANDSPGMQLMSKLYRQLLASKILEVFTKEVAVYSEVPCLVICRQPSSVGFILDIFCLPFL